MSTRTICPSSLTQTLRTRSSRARAAVLSMGDVAASAVASMTRSKRASRSGTSSGSVR